MEPSYSVNNALDNNLLNKCLEFCKDTLQYPDDISTDPKWYKKGSIHKLPFIKDTLDPLIRNYLKNKDAKLIGDTAFLLTFPPHDVHIDNKTDRYNNIKAYKTVVIPLYIEGTTIPKFYTANQYFFGDATTRFRKGSKDKDSLMPNLLQQSKDGIKFVYDYEQAGIIGLEKNQVLTKEWYDANIDAGEVIKYEHFHKLSIEKEHNWQPGNIIIFDSNRLHFSQNLRKINCKYKIGISLNYALDN